MGRKIFVSYKYSDFRVQNLSYWKDSTARDYITEFEKILDASDHIYKGESDGEDLSGFSESKIYEKLRNRIYDSTVTVIFISPGIKEDCRADRDQWIPWEISYSLREQSRKNKNGESITSKANALLAVVLPDSCGSYAYFTENMRCCPKGLRNECTRIHTENLFDILRKNMFNKKRKFTAELCCELVNHAHPIDQSYIEPVKWCDFIKDYNRYIERACTRQSRIDEYIIQKEI